jgi:hypothetical protein
VPDETSTHYILKIMTLNSFFGTIAPESFPLFANLTVFARPLGGNAARHAWSNITSISQAYIGQWIIVRRRLSVANAPIYHHTSSRLKNLKKNCNSFTVPTRDLQNRYGPKFENIAIDSAANWIDEFTAPNIAPL